MSNELDLIQKIKTYIAKKEAKHGNPLTVLNVIKKLNLQLESKAIKEGTSFGKVTVETAEDFALAKLILKVYTERVNLMVKYN